MYIPVDGIVTAHISDPREGGYTAAGGAAKAAHTDPGAARSKRRAKNRASTGEKPHEKY